MTVGNCNCPEIQYSPGGVRLRPDSLFGRRKRFFVQFYAFMALKMQCFTAAAGENFTILRVSITKNALFYGRRRRKFLQFAFFHIEPTGPIFSFFANLWQQKLGNPKSKNFIFFLWQLATGVEVFFLSVKG